MFLAVVPFSWIALRYSDLPQFGKYQDDGLFLIAGKSLKDSQGYRISSLPGKPFQTKYQPLYPALLAAVWSVDGQFPRNLKLFAALAWATFVAYLLLAFALFRSLGFSLWKSAGMLTLLALNPWLLYWALLPVSDLPVSVLVLATFWILHKHRDDPRWWIAAGLAAAAACLTKSIGILIVPAIWLGGWRRREWMRCLVMTMPSVAVFAGWTVWASLHRSLLEHSVLWYYTDYFAVHVKNGGLRILPQIVASNLGTLIGVAGNSMVYNLADSLAGRFLSVIVLAAAISGTRRLIRRTGAVEYPVFCALLVVLLLLWDFSPNVRLLAPVLPMLAMGLCAEAEHARLLVRRAGQSLKSSDRIAAHLCRVGVVLGCVYALVLNLTFVARGIPNLLDRDRVAFARDRATFEWCKRSLPSSSVVLASNDTFLYLYTGLSAVRPVPNSVAFYRNDAADEVENFTHIDQLADLFGVTHILLAPDDFGDYEPEQRKSIVAMLLSNPRHKQIYSANNSTILEIERPYSTRWSHAPGQ